MIDECVKFLVLKGLGMDLYSDLPKSEKRSRIVILWNVNLHSVLLQIQISTEAKFSHF
jgi:hypothetical protein